MASYNLGATQRQIIRGHEAYDEGTRNAAENDVQVELREFETEAKTGSKKAEKKRYWLPKCFLLGIGLMILLAGMVVLIYFFKAHESGQRGNISSTPPSSKECEDIVVALGEDVEIICKMNKDIPGDVAAIQTNKVGATEDDFTCDRANRTVSCRAKKKAMCSSYGKVTIRFYDSVNDDKKVNFTRTVWLNGTYAFPTTAIDQMQHDPTQFNLQCSYKKNCSSYEVGFYGKNNISIADSVSCKTSFSDSEGYNVICSATVSSKLIYEFGNGSVLNCHLKHGDEIMETKELEMPACKNIPFWKEACNANVTNLFDCKNTQDVMNTCNKTCVLANECFSARVYEMPSNTSSYRCPDCALKWCREADTLKIDDTGAISFNELCRAG